MQSVNAKENLKFPFTDFQTLNRNISILIEFN